MKNRNRDISSIFKNYILMENVYLQMSINLNNLRRMLAISRFFPKEVNFVRGLTSFLGTLYYEAESTPTLYSIPGSFVIELRGSAYPYYLDGKDFVSLVHELVQDRYTESTDDIPSFLGFLALRWKDDIRNQKVYPNFVDWFKSLNLREMSTKKIQRFFPKNVRQSPYFKKDFDRVSEILNQGFMTLRYPN